MQTTLLNAMFQRAVDREIVRPKGPDRVLPNMQLHELKSVLREHARQVVRFTLPGGDEIPAAFHVTEVGQVSKVFVDCGGNVHSDLRCVLQTWIGPDTHHRLSAETFGKILELGRAVVATDALEVEVEYEDDVISQYPIAGWASRADALVFDLTTKHTDCLARERCLPVAGEEATCGTANCC